MLVNNAGIETIVPFLELTDEQWTRLVDVNLRGDWLCSQVFCRRAIAEGRKGNIVNIGSIQAAKVLPGRTHYAPTKLGLEALTRNMSAEMTPLGIRVNCVHPGLIDTDMTAWVMKRPTCCPHVLAQISLGRAGEPREIGTVVAFFASDEASYLTGQSIHVDGGWEGKVQTDRPQHGSLQGDDDVSQRRQAGDRRDGESRRDGEEHRHGPVRCRRDHQSLHDRHRRSYRHAHRFLGPRQAGCAARRRNSDRVLLRRWRGARPDT